MTVFQYLQCLPQPIFEATLLGLMGLPINPDREAWFHEWMNKPYDEVFPTSNPSIVAGNLTIPLDSMITMLQDAADILSPENQEKLLRATNDYCAVLDHVRQIVNHQKNVYETPISPTSKWCVNQSVDEMGKVICLAHLAEARVPDCPYKSKEERASAKYPCSDYEGVRT